MRTLASRRRRSGRRVGAILSLELLLVLPILITIILGVVELSLLMMGMQRVQAASRAACLVGTLPADDWQAQEQAMRDAAEQAMGNAGMIDTYEIEEMDTGTFSGDPVVFSLSVPMTAAAPDLLRVIGLSLEGRQLASRTEMCKQ
jgi:Flp pilus assembly protein TadG